MSPKEPNVTGIVKNCSLTLVEKMEEVKIPRHFVPIMLSARPVVSLVGAACKFHACLRPLVQCYQPRGRNKGLCKDTEVGINSPRRQGSLG